MSNGVTGPRTAFAAALLTVCLLPLLAESDTATVPAFSQAELAPEPRHEKVGQLVRDFIERSHYSHASVDDDLSALVMDRYLEALDSNRM